MLQSPLERTAEFFAAPQLTTSSKRNLKPPCLLKSKGTLKKHNYNIGDCPFQSETALPKVISPRSTRCCSEQCGRKLTSPQQKLLRMESKVLNKIFNY